MIRTKFLLVFFVLVLAFGILGCTGQKCDSKSDENIRFNCYVSEAEKSNNSNICENLPNGSVGYTRDNCYWHLINYQYSDTNCLAYANESKRTHCLSELANRKKDPTICDKMNRPSYLRDGCFQTVAYFTENLSFCNKMENASKRDLCYSGIAEKTRDVAICEKIFGYEDKQWCYVFVARKAKDPSYCNKLDPQYTFGNMSIIDYCLYRVRIS